MLTKIVSPETMPKNNRKMPKEQRFIIGALGIGKRQGIWELRAGGKFLSSAPFPTSLDKVNFVTMGRNVLQGLALRQYLRRK